MRSKGLKVKGFCLSISRKLHLYSTGYGTQKSVFLVNCKKTLKLFLVHTLLPDVKLSKLYTSTCSFWVLCRGIFVLKKKTGFFFYYGYPRSMDMTNTRKKDNGHNITHYFRSSDFRKLRSKTQWRLSYIMYK